MSFAFSVDTITQTGTDTDLTGLVGLSGVTTNVIAGQTIYTLDSATFLVVEGTLTYQNDTERLVLLCAEDDSQKNLKVESGGTLTIGRIAGQTPDGEDYYAEGVGFQMPNSIGAEGAARSRVNGTLILYGGVFETGMGIAIPLASGGLVEAYSTRIVNVSTSSEYILMRNDEGPDHLVLSDVVLTGRFNSGRLFSRNGLDSFSGAFENAFVQTRSGTHTNALALKDITFSKNRALSDLQINGSQNTDQSQAIEVTNVDVGTASRIGETNADREGHIAVFQEIIFSTNTPAGVAIEDAKVRIKTTDSGNRVNSTRPDAITFFQNYIDYATLGLPGGGHDVYEQTTDAQGVTTTIKVLTGRFWDQDNAAVNLIVDLYCESQTIGVDNFTAKAIHYNKQISEAPITLNGVGIISQQVTMVDDTVVTETTRPTVDAYPVTAVLVGSTLTVTGDAVTLQALTAAQLYDFLKSYLVVNFAGETVTIVTREGVTIDGRALDIVLDYITYTGNITTTGTLTLNNGSTVSGLITDATGSNNTVTITDLVDSNVQIINAANTVLDRQTAVTGTYNYSTAIGVTGAHKIIINRLGYAALVIDVTFTGAAYSFGGGLIQATTPSGGAMYQATSSANLAVVPTLDGSSMRANIGNATVSAQEVYDETEVALLTEDGMSYLGNSGGACTIASLATGTFLFLGNNYQLKRALVGDSSATVEAFVTSTQGTVVDNTNGDVQFVTVTRAQQLTEYGGFIWVDLLDGVDENQYPAGTPSRKTNSITNALVLAEFYGLSRLKVSGDTLNLPEELMGFTITSDPSTNASASLLPTITLSVANGANNCVIDGFIVEGETDVTSPVFGNEYINSVVNGLTGLTGLARGCKLAGTLQVEYAIDLVDCYGTAVIAPTGTNATVSIPTYSGALTIGGMTSSGATVSVGVIAGTVTIDSSCTAGTIIVANADLVTDNSTGATVIILNDSVSPPTVEEIRTEIDDNSTKLAALETKTQADARQVILVAEHDATQADLTLVKAKTDNLPASPAAIGSQMTLEDSAITAAKIATAAFTNTKFADSAIGSRVAPNLNATVSSRASSANLLIVKAKTDLLTFTGTDIHSTLDGETVVASNMRGTDDALLSADARLNNLDAAVSSRLSTAGYTAPLSSGQTETAVVNGLGTYTAPTKAELDTTELEIITAINALSLASNPVYYAPTTATRVVGDDDGGSVTNLAAVDGSFMVTGETTSGLEVIVERDLSNAVELPAAVRVTGYYDSQTASHDVQVYTYNYVTLAWDFKATMDNRSSSFEYVIPLEAANAGTDGIMRLRFLHNVVSPYVTQHALYLDAVIWEKVQTNSSIAQDIAQILSNQLELVQDTIVASGFAQGPGANDNQIQLAVDESNVDGAYDPSLVTIVSGPCAGQSRIILQYDGTTKIAVVHRDWKDTLPTVSSKYVITAYADTQNVNEGLVQAAGTNTATLNINASTVDDMYLDQIMFVVSGAGADQSNLCIGYVGSTKVATFNKDWVVPLDSTSAYVMIPASPASLSQFYETKAQADARQDIITAEIDVTQLAVSQIPINPLLDDDVRLDIIGSNVDAILADTNELQLNQGDWITADVSSLATQASLDTVDSNVDAILADTGNISSLLSSGDLSVDVTKVAGTVVVSIDDFKLDPDSFVLEGTETLSETLRLIRSESAGQLVVAGNLVYFKSLDGNTDRIIATTDDNGQRSNIITDGS